MTAVPVQKLSESDAFLVFDLDPAAPHVGIVRAAPKILVDGATTLARSLTYLYASFEQQVGGASAGINAKPDDRATAIAAFVGEVSPRVESGALQLLAGKGLGDDDLAPLRAVQPPGADAIAGRELLGIGAVAAAARARGDLDGARVAVDGLEPATASLLEALGAAGATIVAVATTAGTIADPSGIDPGRLLAALGEHGAALVEHLDLEVAAPAAVFGADADVLFTGSKVGAVDHVVAASIAAGLVVPIGPVPVSAKALAVLRRAGTVVLPDFLSAAGPWFATFPGPPPTLDELRATTADRIGAALDDVLGHEDGPLLGACYRAEAYLGTWQSALPFGRPLA
jgi:glutamate dehydrogenase/leucine dehydrogenase